MMLFANRVNAENNTIVYAVDNTAKGISNTDIGVLIFIIALAITIVSIVYFTIAFLWGYLRLI